MHPIAGGCGILEQPRSTVTASPGLSIRVIQAGELWPIALARSARTG